MKAGRLRHRITIEQVTESRSDSGSITKSWSTFAQRWAEMEGLTGNERFEAEREHGEVDHRFRLRYLDGVTTKMRVKYDSRVFDIEARFDPTGKGEELVLLTVEKEA